MTRLTRAAVVVFLLAALSPLVDWTKQMAGFWEKRFDQLEDLLKRMDQ